jgi:addiction module RelB/DinJ family antitoxin
MNTKRTEATGPKTSTFQIRVNLAIRNRVEAICAGSGLALSDAINLFFQQALNADGLPLRITSKSRRATRTP